MYLKDDRIVATIGDLVMRSSKTGVGNEYILDPTAFEGWTDGTNVRRPSIERPTSHGDFSEKATMAARLVSFSGTAVARSAQDLQAMRDKMVGTLSNGEYKTLSVETSSGTRYATVGLEGTTSWVQQTDTIAVWKINFFAPDPRIYGEENRITIGAGSYTGGLTYILTYPLVYNVSKESVEAAVIENHGNSPAWPTIVVTGDYFSGFSLNDNRGNTVTYTGVITMSSPVTVDMSKGTATQSGWDRSTYLSSRDWWSVNPGDVIRPTFNPIQSGNGWCDIIIRDTWI